MLGSAPMACPVTGPVHHIRIWIAVKTALVYNQIFIFVHVRLIADAICLGGRETVSTALVDWKAGHQISKREYDQNRASCYFRG